MKDPSVYDGLTSRKDEYEVMEDDEGFGVRNVTQAVTFQPRWTQFKFALDWKFCLRRFRWQPVQRKRYAILKMASTRLKRGVTAADFSREWYIEAMKEKRDPEMSDDDFYGNCNKRGRNQLRRYVREGLVRCEPKGDLETWFIEPAGTKWLKEVDNWLATRKRRELVK